MIQENNGAIEYHESRPSSGFNSTLVISKSLFSFSLFLGHYKMGCESVYKILNERLNLGLEENESVFPERSSESYRLLDLIDVIKTRLGDRYRE